MSLYQQQRPCVRLSNAAAFSLLITCERSVSTLRDGAIAQVADLMRVGDWNYAVMSDWGTSRSSPTNKTPLFLPNYISFISPLAFIQLTGNIWWCDYS